MSKISRSFATHDGSFHADEIVAAAFLLLFSLIDKDKIYRSRERDILEKCEFICDEGGIYDAKEKRFDHHQVEYGGKLSSAGMVLKFLRDSKIMEPALYDYFNNSLVLGVDAHDIGEIHLKLGFCSFSQVISNFLPIDYAASPEEMEEAFFRALDFTLGHLRRLKERFFYMRKCGEEVKREMAKSKYVIFFEKPLSWMESFFEFGGKRHSALFVIMPTKDNWKLRGIPPSYHDRMKVRLLLPEEWAGLRNEDLIKVSKIEGAIFCHKGRFISIWKTKEDAIKAVKYVLQKHGIKDVNNI